MKNLILLSFLCAVSACNVIDTSSCEDHILKNLLPKSINATVKNKDIPIRLKQIRFNESDQPHFTLVDGIMRSLYDHAEKNDSLVNYAGSLEFILIKPDTTLYFYPECVDRKKLGTIRNLNFRLDNRPLYINPEKEKKRKQDSLKWELWLQQKQREYEYEYQQNKHR